MENPGKPEIVFRSSPQKILRVLFVMGVVLDTWYVFGVWSKTRNVDAMLASSQEIVMRIAYSRKEDSNLEEMKSLNFSNILSQSQKRRLELVSSIGSGFLLLFLIWDYFAFFSLLKFKRWARVYVLFIACSYLVSSFFDFSPLYFAYAIAVIFVLMKYRSYFKKEREVSH